VKATAAIAQLLRDSAEWRAFFRGCCEAGALRLRSQARQFRNELGERDRAAGAEAFALSEVEDALLTIARKVLPDTPAARWDPELAAELCADALSRISERYVGISAAELEVPDFSARDLSAERMNAAAAANDPAAFRGALGEWEQATIGAIEGSLERRSGAA